MFAGEGTVAGLGYFACRVDVVGESPEVLFLKLESGPLSPSSSGLKSLLIVTVRAFPSPSEVPGQSNENIMYLEETNTR